MLLRFRLLAVTNPAALMPKTALKFATSYIIMASLALVSCGFQEYVAKPIDKAAITEKITARRADDQQFQQYLLNNGYSAEQLPIKLWTRNDLIYCALFFNPSLDVARAQWRSAEAAKLTAAEMRLPTISGNYAKSNNASEEISPHAYSLSIDLPIETANKRNIRIESAQHLAEAAKLRIAQAAWQLRNEVTKTLYDLQFNQQLIKMLSKEQAQKQDIVSIFQKRISLGESSNIELSKAKLQLQATTTELESTQRNHLTLLARLANQLGLSLAQVEQMQLAQAANANMLIEDVPADMQSIALLNRLDIRLALERYAVAEAKLKLEIAKQYPDLKLSPGYTYEFGDKIWSLGLSSLMTILTKNKLAIAEASQLREVEAAQFESLQANVISEVNIANAKLTQARQLLENQNRLFQQQQTNTLRMDRRFNSGESDRLELTYAKLEEVVAEKSLSLANFQFATSINELENVIQAPLADSSISNEKIEKLYLNKQQ
jgi:outer membrane protein TolC